MADNLLTLYKAGQGKMTMVSARPAITLKPHEYPDISNGRYRFDCYEVRKPDATFSTTGLPGTTGSVPYAGGSWSGLIGGVEYALVAVKNGTAVDIYESADGAAWTNRSSTTVKAYGITQLTDATAATNGVTFQAVSDPILGEAVVISDGTTVLLWQPTAVNSERLRKVVSISSSYGNTASVTFIQQAAQITEPFLWTAGTRVGTTWNVGAGAAGTYVLSGAGILNNSVEALFSTTILAGTQFSVYCTIPSIPYDIFSACKMELYSNGAYTTIYDPSSLSPAGSPPVIETYLTADTGLGLPGMFATWSLPNTFGAFAISRMRLTYKGAAGTFAAGTYQIYAAMSNGINSSTSAPPAGTPDYAIAYRNSGTAVESPSKVIDSAAATGMTILSYYGSGSAISALPTLPISTAFRGKWTIVDNAPPDPTTDGAFNQFCLYRKDSGSTDYFFVDKTDYTTWTPGAPGSWALNAATQAAFVTDTKDENGLNYERPAPSAFSIAPSGFRCAIGLNDRLFIGTVNEYRFSEFKYPMRFGLTVDVNAIDRSSGAYRFKSETPKAFYSVVDNNSYDRGVDKAGIVTDQMIRLISGLDTFSLMRPSKLYHFGTNSPKGFTTRRDTTFFLDDARRIHTSPFSAGLDSKNADVKDILDGISSSNISKVVAANFNDLIFIFYTPSGQSVNNAAIVIDMLSGTLSRDTYTLGVTSAIVNGSRLIAFMSDGTVRQLESTTPATVAGVSLVSREIGTASDSWAGKAQRIYCDGVAATDLTVSWTPYKVGTAGIITDTLSIAPDAGEDRTDRFSPMGKGVRGRSIKFGFSGTVMSGTKFYAWQAESEGRIQEGDR